MPLDPKEDKERLAQEAKDHKVDANKRYEKKQEEAEGDGGALTDRLYNLEEKVKDLLS